MPARPGLVLLVDGDAAHLEVLRMVLEQAGHVCEVATTAFAAWTHCVHQRFDCALIHASLEGASGLALVDRLASDIATRPGHIVLMSGRPRDEFARQLRDGVVDGFLRKPAEASEVLAVLSRCLST